MVKHFNLALAMVLIVANVCAFLVHRSSTKLADAQSNLVDSLIELSENLKEAKTGGRCT